MRYRTLLGYMTNAAMLHWVHQLPKTTSGVAARCWYHVQTFIAQANCGTVVLGRSMSSMNRYNYAWNWLNLTRNFYENSHEQQLRHVTIVDYDCVDGGKNDFFKVGCLNWLISCHNMNRKQGAPGLQYHGVMGKDEVIRL